MASVAQLETVSQFRIDKIWKLVQIRFIFCLKIVYIFYMLRFYLVESVNTLIYDLIDTLIHFCIGLLRIQKHKIDSNKIHFLFLDKTSRAF